MFLENIRTLKSGRMGGPIKIAVGFVASTMQAVGRRKSRQHHHGRTGSEHN